MIAQAKEIDAERITVGPRGGVYGSEQQGVAHKPGMLNGLDKE